jgi:hypothetical protein
MKVAVESVTSVTDSALMGKRELRSWSLFSVSQQR